MADGLDGRRGRRVREDGRVNDSWAGALLEVRGVGVTRGGPDCSTPSTWWLTRWWTAVVGPNGPGKSTLLRSSSACPPARGAVRVDGVATTGVPAAGSGPGSSAYAPQTPVLPEAVTVARVRDPRPHPAPAAAGRPPRAGPRRWSATSWSGSASAPLAERAAAHPVGR